MNTSTAPPTKRLNPRPPPSPLMITLQQKGKGVEKIIPRAGWQNRAHRCGMLPEDRMVYLDAGGSHFH